ncbi:MAG: hypothetical protein WA982_14915 [Rubrobacteraceae bacterium]
MQGRISQQSSSASQDADDSQQPAASSVGKVVAFPGHRPTDGQLQRVLGVLDNTGPMSVRHLKMEAGLSEDLLKKCVERLADAGLLTAEDRKDGNALRMIVSTTEAGRRLLAASGEDGAAPRGASEQAELA